MLRSMIIILGLRKNVKKCKTPENLKFPKSIKKNNKLLKWLREA